MASGDIINYSIRPAKTVERKIIRDIFFNLSSFYPLENYRYIGFGSKYFSDFKLFHKDLHIEDMVSIEGDVDNARKYEFNKPFKCIDLKLGMSTEVLTELEYVKPYICWLDYDYALKQSVLDDIDILLENILSGSVVSVSLNVRPYRIMALREELSSTNGTHSELLRQKLESIVESQFVPISIPERGLNKVEVFSEIIRNIIVNKINNKINQINSAVDDEDKIIFNQIYNFFYKDGAEMSTWGWVFYKKSEQAKYDLCNFERLNYYSNNQEIYSISIPNFTIKEINKLLEYMPYQEPIDRDDLPIEIYKEEDVRDFSKIYKYYPSFVSAEFG
ncbi:O-methyltransferase [Photobacterium damselae]|uniref:O-methyltransferase n=1 Tax=Photobacterium damselae TaxID=38293 RepID=UPI003B674DF7